MGQAMFFVFFFPPAHVARRLARAVEKFPSWEPRATAAVKACKRVPGSRLDGIQLVEVRAPTQLEDQDMTWLFLKVGGAPDFWFPLVSL